MQLSHPDFGWEVQIFDFTVAVRGGVMSLETRR